MDYAVFHLFCQSSDAAFWVTSDAHFSCVKQGACRALSYTREELLKILVECFEPSQADAAETKTAK